MSKIAKIIKERIKEEGGPQEAIELNLSQINLKTIDKESKAILEKAQNIEVLFVNSNELSSFDNFPDWNLVSLNAAQNKFTDSSLSKLRKYPELVELILTKNDIKTFEGITSIFSLKSLQNLDLSENPVSKISGYRQYIFEKMPNLKILDQRDRDGNEVQQDDQDDQNQGYPDQDQDDDQDEDDISDDQSSGDNNHQEPSENSVKQIKK